MKLTKECQRNHNLIYGTHKCAKTFVISSVIFISHVENVHDCALLIDTKRMFLMHINVSCAHCSVSLLLAIYTSPYAYTYIATGNHRRGLQRTRRFVLNPSVHEDFKSITPFHFSLLFFLVRMTRFIAFIVALLNFLFIIRTYRVPFRFRTRKCAFAQCVASIMKYIIVLLFR